MPESVIQADGLNRSFGSGPKTVHAVVDVSLSIEDGEIVGLLGVNGAGKTTLTQILSTLLRPTSGRATVLGWDLETNPKDIRRHLSVVFGGDGGLYRAMSGVDNLRYFAVLGGVRRKGLKKRVDWSLEVVGLTQAASRPVQTYSKGMKQRLHLAIGMITDPSVLLLDEPTVGLDPIEADRLRRSIIELREQGVSVLLTSHQLLDVEKLADRVVLMHKGRITHDMSLESFAANAGYAAVITVRGIGTEPLSGIDSLPESGEITLAVTEQGWEAAIPLREWNPNVFGMLSHALAGLTITDVQVRQPRLEEAFVALAGRLDA